MFDKPANERMVYAQDIVQWATRVSSAQATPAKKKSQTPCQFPATKSVLKDTLRIPLDYVARPGWVSGWLGIPPVWRRPRESGWSQNFRQ
jgi:hypothetical protein